MAIVVILASSGTEPDETVPGDENVPGDETAVDWENYAPAVKERIDTLAIEGDCPGLQAEFDTADENDDAQRDRVGDGNADLMDYIDDKLRDAGCYG